MGSRKIRKAAIVTGAVAILLAVGEYSDFVDRVAVFLGIPIKYVPYVCIALFIAAWLIQRHSYESADYEFTTDPDNECAYKEISHSEIHRVAVKNTGHVPITASVFVARISPQPPQLPGKSGMPLVPMGAAGDKTDCTVVINPGRVHSFNLAAYLYTEAQLHLWHAWAFSGATTLIPRSERYEFTVVLSPAEGRPKTETFALNREPDPAISDRMYRLSRKPNLTWLERWEPWLESPVERGDEPAHA